VSLRPVRALAAVACLVLLARPARVEATCGSANCFLVTGTQDGVGNRGQLVVDLSFRYVDQDRKLSGTRKVGEILTPKVDFENGVLEPDHHREIRTQNTLVEIDMSYGLTDRLALEWHLPLVNDRDHEHFGDVGTIDEHFSRGDGSSGFGDIRAGVRYALAVKARQILVGGLAIKAPTGEYRLRDSEGEINEPTIQPGTGSTDVIGSLAWSRQVVPQKGEWFLSGSYRWNGENGLDYRFGDETQATAGFRFRTERLVTWSLQVNGRRAGRDEFLGEGVPSTGSTLVNLTPGLRFEGKTGTSIYGFVQVPVYQKVNEVNLAPGSGIMLGVSHAF
jgi:hypothetical protein